MCTEMPNTIVDTTHVQQTLAFSPFSNSVIEIPIYCRIDHFQVYNSVVFSIFRESCSYHHNLIHHPQKNPISSHSPPFQIPLHLVSSNLLSVSMDLPVLDIFYNWNHIPLYGCTTFCLPIHMLHCPHRGEKTSMLLPACFQAPTWGRGEWGTH